MRKFIRAYFCFSFIVCFLYSSEVVAHTVPPALRELDFSIAINKKSIALGDRWDNDVAHKIKVPTEGQFVGEIPFDGVNYKFYQHHQAELDVFSSNLLWDKTERNVNDYIVSQITIYSEECSTPRGIHVGSTIEELNKAYGAGQSENDSGEQWVSYELGIKLLSFKIKDNMVVKISMNYAN